MVFALDLLVAVIGLGVFAQHVWALRGHFASDKMTGGARAISAGALLSCLLLLVVTFGLDQPMLAQLAGGAVMAASLLLFWAAIRASRAARLRFAFDEALPSELVTIGPYKRVRHPFYTSYLVFWAGWAIAAWTPLALLPVIVMAALYTVAARYEENLLISSNMANSYKDYRQRTGMFFPRITPGTASGR